MREQLGLRYGCSADPVRGGLSSGYFISDYIQEHRPWSVPVAVMRPPHAVNVLSLGKVLCLYLV